MATSISPGVEFSDELACYDVESGLPYSGAATIYASLRDTTTEEWWDAVGASWGAEPSLGNLLTTTDPGNGDRRFTIPAAATAGKSGNRLSVRLVTTLTESAEVIVSEKRTYDVASTTTGAGERFASGVTVTGTMIAAAAGNILNDPGHDRWTLGDILGWINEAQNRIVLLKPDTYTVAVAVSLASGTRQLLPASSHKMVRPTRNLGAGGGTPGAAIDLLPIDALDSAVPDWHSSAYASAEVQAILYDEKHPHAFYVWPPQPDGTNQVVEIIVQGSPPPLALISDPITLDDIWEGAILDYVLHRAFGKETTSQTSQIRAQEAYGRFVTALTGRISVDAPPPAAPEKGA